MKKIIMSLLAAAAMSAPALADPIKEDDFFTPHAQGCMLLQECTDHVQELKTVSDLNKHEELADSDYGVIADEFNSLIRSLNTVGAKVFLADLRYFPVGHRGVYHTVSNNFFLNVAHMHRPGTMMSVMRHEGWHAAQDCMAGTIDNTFTAVVLQDGVVPDWIANGAEKTYPKQAVPYEAEAMYAAFSDTMTRDGLKACAGTKKMWEVYEPTPLTEKWLVEQGFIAK